MTPEDPRDTPRSVGERWFADATPFEEDLPRYWGDWGVDSEYGGLKAVLVRRPGREWEGLTDPVAIRFRDLPDPAKARDQHDQLMAVYAQHGVKVHYVEEMAPDKPNGLFCRDLCVMTPEGAILARPALAVRRGEERYLARTLGQLGVPIIRTVNGRGTFEGADLMWLDRSTAFLGLGNRSNADGVAQVERELRAMGCEHVIQVQIGYGSVHLDGFMNIVDSRTAVCFPWKTPFVVVAALRDRGFRLLEIANVHEYQSVMPSNFVALAPGLIVMPAGAPETARMYRQAGIEVIEADVSELQKGWGAMHCMTTFLKREPVGRR
ncbi:MAG: arginine deiminase family protein [bacterium]|nr:arginine deiminase family protein [bacterium]